MNKNTRIHPKWMDVMHQLKSIVSRKRNDDEENESVTKSSLKFK